jgi:hypothetical protein
MQLTQPLRSWPFLGVLSVVSFAFSFWLMFRAGCAGDLKTGSYGDPQLALELESIAMPFFLLGAVGLMALTASLKRPMPQRIGIAAASVLFGGPLLWLLAIQFEVWGVQACF